MRRVHTFAVSARASVFRALLVVLAATLSIIACGDSPQEPAVLSHFAGGTIYVYSSANTIKDIELLVDDESVARQQFPTGSALAYLTGGKAFASPGTHTVSLRVSDQTVSPTVYQIEGSAVGLNTANNSQVTVPILPLSGTAMRSMATGAKLSVTVNVP
jgi:hypothetical protein